MEENSFYTHNTYLTLTTSISTPEISLPPNHFSHEPTPPSESLGQVVSQTCTACLKVAGEQRESTNRRGWSARHQVVSSDSRSPPDSTDGASKGHRDGECKGGGDATPEIEEARGRTRSRARWSETEAAAGRAAALTASVSVLRYLWIPPRDTRGEGGMQRENTRHTRRRSAGACPRREARQPSVSIPTSPEKK